MTGNICVYCPGGPDSDFEYSTQSYTGYEPTCLTGDHDVLSRTGWVPIHEVTCDMDVLTINPHSLCVQWQRVTETHAFDAPGQLFKLAGEQIDAVCTGWGDFFFLFSFPFLFIMN